MKKAMICFLAMIFMLSLTACGDGSNSTETSKVETVSESVQEEIASEPVQEENTEEVVEEATEPEKEAAEAVVDPNPAGTYTSFAVVSAGEYIDVNLANLAAELTLNEGGTGTLTADDENEEITWEVEGKKGDRVVIKEGMMEFYGPYENGILEINLMGTTNVLFVKETADISSYNLITSEEEFKKYQEEMVIREEEAFQNILKKYGLKNDDTHYVIKNFGMIYCYEMDGDISTGSKVYAECFTERLAGLRKEVYERSSLYDYVEVDGTIIIIDMGGGMTRDFLDEHYGDKKIDPE